MNKIICGELEYNNKEYKFDFRDNLLVLIPNQLDKYKNKLFINKTEFEFENIEGITNRGYYICFVKIKLSHVGGGVLQAFVPAYIVGNTNTLDKTIKCDNISKIRFLGNCIDNFCKPKNAIETNDFFTEKTLKVEINNKKLQKIDYIINNDTYSFGIDWNVPIHSDISIALKLYSFLEINFQETKSIEQLLDYCLKVKKFFSFINFRKYVTFNNIKMFKNIKVNYGFDNRDDIRDTTLIFDFFFVDPDEYIDLNDYHNSITLKDINNKFNTLYKETTNDKFLINYYPLNNNDKYVVDNDKFVNVSSAFESEFDKLFPNFKSNVNEEFKEIKAKILKSIYNKKRLAKKEIDTNKDNKHLKNIIKQCNYFNKIIKNINGTLSDKITFSLKQYDNIIKDKKETLRKNYNLNSIKIGNLSSDFAQRRNDISHGNGTKAFTTNELISYELIRICIYCMLLEKCGFEENEIQSIINKIF